MGNVRNYIGGSDIAKILGHNVFGGTAFDVWLRLTKPELYAELTDSDEERLAFDIGNHFERFCLEKMVDRLNVLGVDGVLEMGTIDSGPPVTGPLPWQGCHEDGWLVRPNGDRILLEAKTSAQREVNQQFADGEVPEFYRLQLVWMMHIFGKNEAYIGCINKERNTLNIVHFEATDEEIAEVIEPVVGWYTKHVVGGVPVLPVGDVASAAASKVFGAGDGERDATSDEEALMRELASVKAKIKELTDVEELLVANIKLRMAESGKVRGAAGSVSWTTPKTSLRLDTKALQKAEPGLCAKYMREVEASRRFAFYPKKEA